MWRGGGGGGGAVERGWCGGSGSDQLPVAIKWRAVNLLDHILKTEKICTVDTDQTVGAVRSGSILFGQWCPNTIICEIIT